jgi:hypothetical protein
MSQPNVVRNLAELSALPAEHGRRVHVLGRSYAGDSGGGWFNCKSEGSIIDGGLTVMSETAGYYWQRDDADFVRPEWFGAAGDGIQDDREALTRAFATGLPVYLGAGANYLVEQVDYSSTDIRANPFEGVIFVESGQNIIGEGQGDDRPKITHTMFHKPVFVLKNCTGNVIQDIVTNFKGFRGQQNASNGALDASTGGHANSGQLLFSAWRNELYDVPVEDAPQANGNTAAFAIYGGNSLTFRRYRVQTDPSQRNAFECGLLGIAVVSPTDNQTEGLYCYDCEQDAYWGFIQAWGLGTAYLEIKGYGYPVVADNDPAYTATNGKGAGNSITPGQIGAGHLCYMQGGTGPWEFMLNDTEAECLGEHEPTESSNADHDSLKIVGYSGSEPIKVNVDSKRPHGAIFTKHPVEGTVVSDMRAATKNNHSFAAGYSPDIFRDGGTGSTLAVTQYLPDFALDPSWIPFGIYAAQPQQDAARIDLVWNLHVTKAFGRFRFDCEDSTVVAEVTNAGDPIATQDLGTVGGYNGSGNDFSFKFSGVQSLELAIDGDDNTVRVTGATAKLKSDLGAGNKLEPGSR